MFRTRTRTMQSRVSTVLFGAVVAAGLLAGLGRALPAGAAALYPPGPSLTAVQPYPPGPTVAANQLYPPGPSIAADQLHQTAPYVVGSAD
jgi:hypothetical protein